MNAGHSFSLLLIETVQRNTGYQMGAHLVQFYDDEAFLVDEIWSFIGPCLRLGESVVVIATQARLDSLERKYAPSRLRNAAFSSGLGQFIVLNAEATLSRIMADGWPDEFRFREIIGGIMRQATQEGRQHVRAYGEMVAVLCTDGRQDAAIRLEQLWTSLGREYPFSLLCGYPMNAFAKQEHATAFGEICNAHTHVHPAESYRAHAGEDELHRTVAMLQQKANALESEVARRKEIECALHRREKELSDVDRRKDEFLAILGHELRNPLAPIMNSLELMRIHANDTGQVARSRDMIARQVALMTRLVDDLLDVSRITRGKIELKKERISLGHIVERAVEIVQPLIDERRHHLVLNLPPEPAYLYGDSARLAQVLANLLHNAAKYTDAGGRIVLDASEEASNLVLVVSDNGIGIDRELQDKVFDLFVQDANSLAKARGGLGLGLTLVRRLVQLHAGSVEARSEGHGLGSQFIVTLPLRAPSITAIDQHAATEPTTQSVRPRNILIVDDNVDAAESLGEFLKTSGHRIHVAHDGAEAIREAARVRPDVVILDIGMPAMDGYQVAQSLRTEVGLTSSLLVAVTGYAQEQDRLFAQQAGFDHHFAKPLDIRKLTAILSDPQ